MNESGRITLDERNMEIIRRIGAVLYCMTLLALVAIVNYRQFVLHQPTSAYDDIAMLLTGNVVLLVISVLYFGGVTIPRIRPRGLLLVYALVVMGGLIFTLVKYFVILDQPVAAGRILDSLRIVGTICALLLGLFAVVAWIGRRRTDHELEDED